MTADLFIQSDAAISECGTFRWSLTRIWDESRPLLGFCMLNPSKADGSINDPTVVRCIGFARGGFGRAGVGHYGGIIVGNLNAYRATDPVELTRVADPVGPKNDRVLLDIAARCELLVCAWGTLGVLNGRDVQVLRLLQEHGFADKLRCLGVTQAGHPKHPLYLAADTKLMPFPLACTHERLTPEGACRACGADCRGIGGGA